MKPDFLLIDGHAWSGLTSPPWSGGRRCLVASIAAASVLAKVTRDRLMIQLDQAFPGYGFAKHKGYPTAEHYSALARLGPCPIHRRSFNLHLQLTLDQASSSK